jgi:cation transport ATPase
MDCAEEAALIRRALSPAKGVAALEFDLIHGLVDIDYDDVVTSEAQLLSAVRSTGLAAHAVHGEAGHVAVAHEHAAHPHEPHASTITILISGVLFLVGWTIESLHAEGWLDVLVHAEHQSHDARAAAAYGASALAALWPMWPRALAAVRHLRLDMHALVCVTVAGAVAIGEWSEAAAVAFLFAVAHRMEAWSIDRARREISALVGRGPSLVAQGDASRFRVDTGVTVEGWGGSGGDTERWIERFAAVYTPTVTALAALVALVPPLVDGAWTTWFYRALFFLVLACPCALVISTPVTMIAALSAAARRGVLVKGGAVLERAARARAATPQALRDQGVSVVGIQAADIDRADVVLKESDERSLALLVRHAQRALRVVRQNVTIALGTKAAFLLAAPFGYAPLWLAVLADTGATVIVTVNGLRLLSAKPDG